MVATTMSSLFVALFTLVASSFGTRAALQAEILALRHQLVVFQKNASRRVRLHSCDQLLCCWLSGHARVRKILPATANLPLICFALRFPSLVCGQTGKPCIHY